MNCGNPLYSDAVTLGGGAGAEGALGVLWRWAAGSGWPLWASVAAAGALLLLGAALALLCRRGRPAPPPPPPAPPLNCDKLPPRSKLSNLAVGRSAAPPAAPPLNNMDTLRSYGSAGDELELPLPRDYRRNLNVEPERKPWSEQMHLQTFSDHKIYNDLKGGNKASRAASPLHAVRRAAGMAATDEGVYHWDCSDWCGAPAAPAITEVAARHDPRDSSSPAAPRHADATDRTDDEDRFDFADGCLYPLHPDQYLPPACGGGGGGGGGGGAGGGSADEGGGGGGRPRLREPDAASLVSMLEERHSLLGGGGGGGGGGSCSDLSVRLCEISDSEAEDGPAPPRSPPRARHTAV